MKKSWEGLIIIILILIFHESAIMASDHGDIHIGSALKIDSVSNKKNEKDTLEVFKRDIESIDFVTKWQWIFGLSVS